MTIVLCLLLFGLKAIAIPRIQLARGHLSLIDLGALITSKSINYDQSKLNLYKLSGMYDENDKSIVVAQALVNKGSCDLNIKTESGLKQLHLILTESNGEDFSFDPSRSRSRIYSEPIKIAKTRSTVIRLPTHINEYVLIGDPDLVKFEHINDFYDKDFLKSFALLAGDKQAKTDLVIASRHKVYKVPLEVVNGNEHMPFVDFTI